MVALIEELITGPDTFEIIRDQVGAILKVEATNQQALAVAASQDPSLWGLRVFLERANPWAEFQDAPDENLSGSSDHLPIVNVRFDADSVDDSASNTVSRQKYRATYHVDCFGYAKSVATGSGHIPGDKQAALECHRAMRLARRILMAGHYTYLAMRGVVWSRMVRTRTVFQPQIGDRTVQNVVGARMDLVVEFSEFSPQVQGNPLELIAFQVNQSETGELLLDTQWGMNPVAAAVSQDGLSLVLTYYDTLDASSVPSAAAFELHGAGSSEVTAVAVAGATVTLTVDVPITEGVEVLLDYLPGASPIKFDGAEGNPVSDLREFAVTNNSTATP